jgi:hypothetical protein
MKCGIGAQYEGHVWTEPTGSNAIGHILLVHTCKVGTDVRDIPNLIKIEAKAKTQSQYPLYRPVPELREMIYLEM